MEAEIRAKLEAFQSSHWPVFQRLAVCTSTGARVEVHRKVEYDATSLAPLTDADVWKSALEFAAGSSSLTVPTKGAAVVLIPIDQTATLLLDCVMAGRIGVVSTLGRKLAEELRDIVSKEPAK